MVGQHYQFNGHELGQTPGDSEGQGGLTCFSPWGHKESGITQRLNNNNNNKPSHILQGCVYVISSIYILDQILHGTQVVHLVSSLAYRFYFYILTWDPATTMNLLNYGLSVDPLRLLAYKITLSANNKCFTSSHPTRCL